MTLRVLKYSWRCNRELRSLGISCCVAGSPEVSKSRVALIFKVAESMTNAIRKEFFINLQTLRTKTTYFFEMSGNTASQDRIPEARNPGSDLT
jgi:hypothetical protein